jgi:hypothetical protein
MRLNKDGYLGIGTDDPQFHLQVDGDVDITGELTAASDLRLKKYIEPVNNALATLSMLNPVSYNFRTDEFPGMELPDRRKMGLIAQEVEQILPELVVESGNGIKSVNYMELIPLIIAAYQEMESEKDREIQELRVSIDLMKSDLETIKRLLGEK